MAEDSLGRVHADRRREKLQILGVGTSTLVPCGGGTCARDHAPPTAGSGESMERRGGGGGGR